MKKNSFNYKLLKNCWEKEHFFVSYAVRGSMIVPGVRAGMPSLNPKGPPVNLPSPLNTRGVKPIVNIGVL